MPAIQIGLGISSAIDPTNDPLAEVRAAESAGFDFVSANDHFHATGPRYELWTLMTWLAANTTTIRIASRVLGVPFRNSAIVAKMAESFDRLSGGRLILGLGAGASDAEFRALGLEVGSLRERIEGLEDALRIMVGVWSARPFSYQGPVHRVEGLELEPAPDHHIPLWLGAVGPRGLAMTGRLADGWIPSIEYAPPERAGDMIRQIKQAASDAGRDPDAITLAYNLEVRVDPAAQLVQDRISGSVSQVTDQILGFRGLGFNAFNLIPSGPDRLDQIARLGSDVVPALREES